MLRPPRRISRRPRRLAPALLFGLPLLALPDPPCVAQDGAGQEGLGALRGAAAVIGLELSDDELEALARDLGELRADLDSLRVPLDNAVPPALVFDPLVPGVTLRLRRPGGATPGEDAQEPDVLGPPVRFPEPVDVTGPDGLAFRSIEELGRLLRGGSLTCEELTRFTLVRLERQDAVLHGVVTLLDERALATARERDRELREGIDRGPLHGIPYGAKDLFAARGGPTTWGAVPYREQVIDHDAAVVRRLEDAGAVLVAKLSLGALAMGDVWFGGRTRNPWDLRRGSSGSSAGSAACVAAGSLPFALGTETLGSIVSPCVRCGVTGLRPTFGRVSREGAMALSWSMDKVGPITRSARDAELVLAAIAGADPADPSTRERPLVRAAELGTVRARIGVLAGSLEEDAALNELAGELEAQGHELVTVTLPEAPLGGLLLTLFAEAAAAFDELTRGGLDDLLTEQGPQAWPHLFRRSRFLPAVEYVNAQRQRTLLCRAMGGVFDDVELLLHRPYAGGLLSITNLTGHPTVVVPHGERGAGRPGSVCFTGRLYDEGTLLNVVERWQGSTTHHRQRPDMQALEAAAKEARGSAGSEGDR